MLALKDRCAHVGLARVHDLQSGMDFRKPEYRAEVFLRFYEFHLRHKAHPGGVYHYFPTLADYYGWDAEQKLWYAAINSLTQYPMTSLAIFQQQGEPFATAGEAARLQDWFDANWANLPFDIDRRYGKKDTVRALADYSRLYAEHGGIRAFYTGSFRDIWDRVDQVYSMGRLSKFSGIEFAWVMGGDFTFDTMFLRDRHGSKSHRNGLCWVLGYEELDWHEKSNPAFDGRYSDAQYVWLEEAAAVLLAEAQRRFAGQPWAGDVGYQTLESTLCCYKSWHRPNRRYPGVYNDMAYGRLLRTAKVNPKLNLDVFWGAREAYLPRALRPECDPAHPQHGREPLVPELQNRYRLTGKIPNMGLDWECFL